MQIEERYSFGVFYIHTVFTRITGTQKKIRLAVFLGIEQEKLR